MVITDPPRILSNDELIGIFNDRRPVVGTAFRTASGEPAVVVNAVTAQAVRAGLKAQRDDRRRKQRTARASRRRNRQ